MQHPADSRQRIPIHGMRTEEELNLLFRDPGARFERLVPPLRMRTGALDHFLLPRFAALRHEGVLIRIPPAATHAL